MPAMPRMNKKAERVAFKILGTPANMRDGKNYVPQSQKGSNKVQRILNQEENNNWDSSGY